MTQQERQKIIDNIPMRKVLTKKQVVGYQNRKIDTLQMKIKTMEKQIKLLERNI